MRLALLCACAAICVSLPFDSAESQIIRNRGTMNNAGTINCNTFQNYRGGTAGTLNNTGTVNASALFDNNFTGSVVNNNANGLINVSGAASDFTNGLGSTYNNLSSSRIIIGNTLTLGTGIFRTISGEVEYAKAGAQAIVSAVDSATYGKLRISGGSGAKSLDGNIIVNDSLFFGTGTTFDVNGKTLTLNGHLSGTGALSASAANSKVVYNAAGAQTVRGTTYYDLTLQNGGTKTADAAVTVNDTLRNTVTFDMSAYALTTGASAVISNTGTIQTSGDVSFGAAHTVGGTFVYQNAATSQTLGASNYNNLTLTGGSGATGQKNFPPATVAVSGTYTVSGGNRNYGTGTFAYASSTAQTVMSSENYYNLSITGASDTSAANYKTADGNLSVSGALTVNAGNTLDMQGYSSSTFGAGSSNSGKIRWSASNVYVPGAGVTEFYGSSAGTVAPGSSYGNLWFTGSGTKTINGSVTATGGNAAFGVTIGNNLTIVPSGVLTVTGMDLNNEGSLTNNGTITVN